MKSFLFLTVFLCGLLHAQETAMDPVAPVNEPDPVAEPTMAPLPEFESITEELTSLDALNDSIARREAERQDIYQRMQAAMDPVQREALLPRLQELNQEIAALNRRFQTMALKTDISLFVEEPDEEFDWQQKAYEIAAPLFDKLEEMTRESRELAELRDGLELNRERLQVAQEAMESLNTLLDASPPPNLKEKLSGLKTLWGNRLEDAENQITFYELQLKQREEADISMLEQSGQAAKQFVRSLGLDLILGVLAFSVVFFGMRYIPVAAQKIRPTKKKGRSFSSRLTTLVWTLLSVLLAIGSMLSIYNSRGNIFLVSLTMIFLIGVAWAGMKTLPAFIEQIRMMLNIGAVRENEVLVWEGLSWKVNNISFRAELVNPRLNGGVITIPTPLLVGQVSRPIGDKEELFPSEEGDWVVLRDGTFGRITYQTPTSVQLVQLGGSQTVFPTADYLQEDPTVLSTGFRREITFDLDYAHLKDITTSIPAAIEAHLETVLTEKLGDTLQHVGVHFAEAAESSLRIRVFVDCTGEAAAKWPLIPMWVQAGIVDLSAREGWSIPFPQLQVHTNA
jgi:small-conductance mechanosensitive channel